MATSKKPAEPVTTTEDVKKDLAETGDVTGGTPSPHQGLREDPSTLAVPPEDAPVGPEDGPKDDSAALVPAEDSEDKDTPKEGDPSRAKMKPMNGMVVAKQSFYAGEPIGVVQAGTLFAGDDEVVQRFNSLFTSVDSRYRTR